MKKRWILLGLIAAAVLGLYVQGEINVARFDMKTRFDGTFVLRGDNDPELSIKFYKYGTRVAICYADFCRLGTTRKDSEALFEQISKNQALYCYEMEYVTGVDGMPPKVADWFDKYYDDFRKTEQTPTEYKEGYFDKTICLMIWPADTSLELPTGGGGSISREKGSERGPPKWLAERFAKAGLK